MQSIMELVLAFLNTPFGITVGVAVLAAIAKWVYSKKPLWEKHEGLLVRGVKLAEKAVPDDTPNAGLAKLDYALKYVVMVLEARGATVKAKDEAGIEDGLSVVHDTLEAEGTLKKTSADE